MILTSVLLPPLLLLDVNYEQLRKIPANKRIAYVNKLAETQPAGRNAHEHYVAAKEAFKAIFMLAPPEDAFDSAYTRVAGDDWVLGLRFEWTTEEAEILAKWLAANEKTLALLRRATDCERCYGPFTSDNGRLSDADLSPATMRFGPLLTVAAMSAAREKRWDDAWDWNRRLLRAADHTYQQPSSMGPMLGRRLAMTAQRQLLEFLEKAPSPPDVTALRRAVLATTQRACPDEVRDTAESLFTIDLYENWYAWAEDPNQHKETEGLLDAWLSMGGMLREVGGREVFENIDEFRTALRKSSLDAALRCQQALEAAHRDWWGQPFAKAWRERDTYARKYQKIATEEPACTLAHSWVGPGRLSYGWAVGETWRHAALTVLELFAYRSRNGQFPESLENLGTADPNDARIDLFADVPLRYKVSDAGKRFTLYSIGPDQKDDGGKDNEFVEDSGDWVYWPPQPPARREPESRPVE